MAGPDRLGKVLAQGVAGLRLTCADCGHAGRMAAAEALSIFGDTATPNRIRERLRCSHCGSRRCDVRI